MAHLDALIKRSLEWVDDFMPAARAEYEELVIGEIDNAEIPELRSRTYAYSLVFIRVLAEAYRLWMREHDSWKPLARVRAGRPLSVRTENMGCLWMPVL